MVDTDGRALKLQAHSADIQDRDGALPLLRASRPSWPFVALGYADGGYAGPRVAHASPIRIEVVRKADSQVGFAVIARRWVFVAHAEGLGDEVVSSSRVINWAAQVPSAAQRRNRLLTVWRLAVALRAEDGRHEVPPAGAFGAPATGRLKPYIYAPEEITRSYVGVWVTR